jgi:hypothetical protein
MKEKDFDYVAKLEKAIKKKYGEEAIQNPAKFWDSDKEKKYLEQLEEFVHKQRNNEATTTFENVGGILISRKLINKERKLRCSVCENKIKKINDDIYVIKYDCCEKCFVNYVENREERWNEGWRPKKCQKKHLK